ncbi:hypothetical protein [Kitasatospora purpeofusca]|uniref:hypothetical protein n=1 Tax=Kitasatospora purpeofusca TaxID=67352 RepID=UPI003818B450
MSLNRENVIWQTEQGTWSIGFFEFEYPDHEDFDPEWDVEYDRSLFWWVSTGHADPDEAVEAYRAEHANPGDASTCIEWSADTGAKIARYEEMATAWQAEHARATAAMDLRPSRERYLYGSPATFKQRTARPLRIRARTHLK